MSAVPGLAWLGPEMAVPMVLLVGAGSGVAVGEGRAVGVGVGGGVNVGKGVGTKVRVGVWVGAGIGVGVGAGGGGVVHAVSVSTRAAMGRRRACIILSGSRRLCQRLKEPAHPGIAFDHSLRVPLHAQAEGMLGLF